MISRLSKSGDDKDGATVNEKQSVGDESKQTTSPMRKRKIQRKDLKTKNKVANDKSDSSFDIRDEVSISEDDDDSNKMIVGTFIYFFPQKPYIICHKKKVYGYTSNSFNKLDFHSNIR